MPVSQYIFTANFATFFISFIMIFFVFMNKIIHKRQLRYFGTAFICLLLCGILESVVYYFSFQPSPNLIQTFATGLLFSGWSIVFCSILEIINITKAFKRFHRIILYIMLFLNVILCMLSCANGIVFYYDSANTLRPGPVGFLPQVIISIYIALMIFSVSLHFKKNLWESIAILFIIVVSIVSIPLQFLLNQPFLITTSITISLLFYFLCIHIQYFRYDTLTMLQNRKSFFLDLKNFSKMPVTILTIKIENLDFFSNTSGIEGYEMAVVSIANKMDFAFEKLGRMYRTRTDELKVLFIKHTDDEIQAAHKIFLEKMKNTPYSVKCSFEIRNPR